MPPVAPSATRESTPAAESRTPPRRAPAPTSAPPPTDDEILGLDSRSAGILPAKFSGAGADESRQLEAGATDPSMPPDASTESPAASPLPESIRAALDANPDLRRAWDDAEADRAAFATPDDARAATARLADLDRLDALFYSRRPEDHAELARAVAALDSDAFASLARAMNGLATETQRHREDGIVGAGLKPAPTADATSQTPSPAQAQSDFFHATNAAAVQGVVDAIETQVDRLLPENISKSARTRVVGEIYRELDSALRANRPLAQQVRDALRSGSLDSEHQRAIVSLVTGRARQALPGVAKRVLAEWTSTVVAAHNDRRARQQAAERRVDIVGSGRAGNDGMRSMSPRDIDYRRLSDSDILNL